jgi:hypothetical protein
METWEVALWVSVTLRATEFACIQLYKRLFGPYLIWPWYARRAADRMLKERREQAERDGRSPGSGYA